VQHAGTLDWRPLHGVLLSNPRTDHVASTQPAHGLLDSRQHGVSVFTRWRQSTLPQRLHDLTAHHQSTQLADSLGREVGWEHADVSIFTRWLRPPDSLPGLCRWPLGGLPSRPADPLLCRPNSRLLSPPRWQRSRRKNAILQTAVCELQFACCEPGGGLKPLFLCSEG